LLKIIRRPAGYTLLELIVVLLLLTIAATVVAPSLLMPPQSRSQFKSIVEHARAAALRRGETVRLHVDQTGAWRVIAGAAPRGDTLMSGASSEIRGGTVDLLFSPLGSCAPPVASNWALANASIDPLTCQLRLR
jgi:prepilin-type N-terminal cleavage/methylation domain-containing protein